MNVIGIRLIGKVKLCNGLFEDENCNNIIHNGTELCPTCTAKEGQLEMLRLRFNGHV